MQSTMYLVVFVHVDSGTPPRLDDVSVNAVVDIVTIFLEVVPRDRSSSIENTRVSASISARLGGAFNGAYQGAAIMAFSSSPEDDMGTR